VKITKDWSNSSRIN